MYWVSLLLFGVYGCWSGTTVESIDTDVLGAPGLEETVGQRVAGTDKKPRKGKWRRLRDPEVLTGEQQAEIDALEALGYVSGSVEHQSVKTVTVYDPSRAQNGLNLYASGHSAEAILVNMEGQELHRWRADFHEVWPDSTVRKGASGTHHFRRAKAFDNGDLIAIFEGKGILRMDRDSRVLWAKNNRAHHDFDFLPNGDLVTLSRLAHIIPSLNKKKPILEDFLVVLDSKGAEKKRVSILDALIDSPFRDNWSRDHALKGDIFHTNSVFVLGDDLEGFNPAFKTGRILTSSRTLNVIFVVDLELEQVVWMHKGDFRKQHDPRIVSGKHLLMFDNVGGKGTSRVLEFDLKTMEEVWTYEASESSPFLSRTLGTAHRLKNGNTLITESEGGRAFEVNGEGEIVWEFYNPHRAGESGEFVAALFEMIRLSPKFGESWLLKP